MMNRRCRTDDEKISQKQERELMLRMAPKDDVPILKHLFSVWDSLLYLDAEVNLPVCRCISETVRDRNEEVSLSLPNQEITSEDIRYRVADWISKVPLSDVMSVTGETDEPVTEEEPERKKKSSLKKFFRRVGRAFRRVLANK